MSNSSEITKKEISGDDLSNTTCVKIKKEMKTEGGKGNTSEMEKKEMKSDVDIGSSSTSDTIKQGKKSDIDGDMSSKNEIIKKVGKSDGDISSSSVGIKKEVKSEKGISNPSVTMKQEVKSEDVKQEVKSGKGISSPTVTVKQEVKSEDVKNKEKVSKDYIDTLLRDELNKLSLSTEKKPQPAKGRKGKLLVLQLNGLLSDIIFGYPPRGSSIPYKMINRRTVFKRPFCDEFLKFCFEKFDVGVWTARAKWNSNNFVDYIFGDMKHDLLFCWDNSHCTETGFTRLEDSNKPLLLKEVKKLYNKNLPWNGGVYDESNTLLLDDAPYKALLNPPNTAIFPKMFTYCDNNDVSLGPRGDLRLYLEGLALSEDFQNYVKEHPFGQTAITNKSSSWGFYEKVICKLGVK
ncbi:hypothetical protein GIB67_009501 [Kingdonia uniflora]|uniref:Mitochondrial import inner membrane translocase subunit TIM50 n=1 Tax=Kingdonia uniflora TaxID=39325 RepID=A0A7J7NWC8_9MAGN|nr:hypothetical protein GIB67_009501 [Kingdonia uniflora]